MNGVCIYIYRSETGILFTLGVFFGEMNQQALVESGTLSLPSKRCLEAYGLCYIAESRDIMRHDCV